MKFTEVAPMMEKGAKIKLKQWKNAYWYLDNKGCLINSLRKVKKFLRLTYFLTPWHGDFVMTGRLCRSRR